jgi:solute carrier family 25 (mitochondrial S-adenosylmethionine transporter), member 26
MYKQSLLRRLPNWKPYFVFPLAAILGDLTGSGILCPSEVLKQKMQAGIYDTMRQGILDISKRKGIAGFYEGYLGGISRDVPFRVVQLTTYEVTKNLYIRLKERKESGHRSNSVSLELTPSEAAVCGAIAGTLSAAVTSPLDRIKTLLMTDSASYGGTVAACATKIWQDGGLTGMMTGVVPRVLYIAPSVAIFFIAYEQVQQRLQHWQPTPEKE